MQLALNFLKRNFFLKKKVSKCGLVYIFYIKLCLNAALCVHITCFSLYFFSDCSPFYMYYYAICIMVSTYTGMKFLSGNKTNSQHHDYYKGLSTATGTSALCCLHAMSVFISLVFVGRWFLLYNPNCFCLVLMRIFLFNIFLSDSDYR